MPQILTEVDEFFPSITVPTAGDSRNAASVELPFQKLTDRSRYLLNRLAAAEAALAAAEAALSVLGHYAQLSYAIGSVVTGNPTNQTVQFQAGGFVLTSNLIYVPAAGWYRLSTYGSFNSNSTADGPTIGVLVRAAGVTLRTLTAVRPGTLTGDPTPEIQASVVFQITDPVTQFIELRASAANPPGSTLSSTGRTEIQRLLNP
jgi:hypothetical protein